MKKRSMNVDELFAQCEADPEWVAARAADEGKRKRLLEELRQAEEPLVQELKAAGFEVESAWDLVNTRRPYAKALPILLKHVRRPYPPIVREGIARALAVREAKYAWNELKQLYRDEPEGMAKDGLAVALHRVADRQLLGEVIELARDTRNGPSRLAFIVALSRFKDPRTQQALLDLRTDPDLVNQIELILRRRAKAAERKRLKGG